MNRTLWTAAFVATLIAAAVLMALSGSLLPDPMGSSFDLTGSVAGRGPRSEYLAVMSAAAIAMPIIVVVMTAMPRRSKIPHPEIWLAASHQAETRTHLATHALQLGCMLALFLAYVHALVIEANRHQPPHMSIPWLMAGVVPSGLVVLAWRLAQRRRFHCLP